MNLKKKMKKILYLFPVKWINKFYLFYNRIFYPELIERKMSFGEKNEDKIFYVIRPRKNSVEGLMALLFYVIQQIGYAEKNNYIPVVDFKNYKTQYNIVDENAWECFFEQISNYSLEEVYQSKNVVLSGINAIYDTYSYLYNKSFNEDDLQKTHLLAKKYIKFSKKAYELYNKELKHISPQKNIGLYLRGTDYINLKPIGEPIQPTVAQAIEHVNTYIENEKNANVFLVTEDERIYKEVKSNLGERIVIVSFDNYIKNYSERDFLANGHSLTQLGENAHIRGLNYLVKIMLLSNCKYIVGGKTCGSWAACMLADVNTKIDIFELGYY